MYNVSHERMVIHTQYNDKKHEALSNILSDNTWPDRRYPQTLTSRILVVRI
jgi:hypothetical protein